MTSHQRTGDEPGIPWTDDLVLEFTRRAQRGSLTGEFAGCKSMVSKLRKFKSMKSVKLVSHTNPETGQTTWDEKPPIIPPVFNAEVSLAALAATTSTIAESLDQLVKATFQLVDATYSINLGHVEKEIEQVHRSLPTNWDGLHEISGALNEILKETKKRFLR